MLISSNSMGLIILSLGVVALVCTFQIADRRRYLIGLVLSVFVLGVGAFQYIGAGFQQWQTSRRIAKLQDQQRLNLEALQERLRQSSSQQNAPQPTAAAPAPAPAATARLAPPPAPKPPRPRR